jgi:hypothetical protein
MPGAVLIGSDQPIPYDREALVRRFADPAVMAHLARGNDAFRDYTTAFAQRALAWRPDTPRVVAPLTDVFPRDEFYLNNPVHYTEELFAEFSALLARTGPPERR